MKRKLKFLLVAALIFAIVPATSVSANNISVTLDGTQIQFDVPPQMVNGRTLVPLRAIFNALGADIQWNQGTQTVTATREGTTVIMQIGNPVITVNGTNVTLDVAPTIIDDATLVPARAVGESFGVDVDWNPTTQTVILVTPGGTTAGTTTQTSTDLTSLANYWFELDGVRFAPGMTFGQLLRPGFYPRSADVLTNTLGTNSSSVVGVHTLDGDRVRIIPIINATVRNTGTAAISIENALVESLIVDVSRGTDGFNNITFFNGIRMGATTQQDIINMLGQPRQSSETSSTVTLTYEPFWDASFTPAVSNDLRTSGFQFTFDRASGHLERVRISFATHAQ